MCLEEWREDKCEKDGVIRGDNDDDADDDKDDVTNCNVN
jgi:hypothetical protein